MFKIVERKQICPNHQQAVWRNAGCMPAESPHYGKLPPVGGKWATVRSINDEKYMAKKKIIEAETFTNKMKVELANE